MAEKKESKKHKILELANSGKSIDEIVAETGFRLALVKFHCKKTE